LGLSPVNKQRIGFINNKTSRYFRNLYGCTEMYRMDFVFKSQLFLRKSKTLPNELINSCQWILKTLQWMKAINVMNWVDHYNDFNMRAIRPIILFSITKGFWVLLPSWIRRIKVFAGIGSTYNHFWLKNVPKYWAKYLLEESLKWNKFILLLSIMSHNQNDRYI
jgi:hypothetical protein